MISDLNRATVSAGAFNTHYLRVGSGPWVFFLTRTPDSAVQSDLVTVLSQRFKLVLPQAPGLSNPPEVLVGWLRGVFEGLGVREAAILCEPSFANAALGFAAEDPNRIRGVAIIVPDNAEAASDVSVALGCCFAMGR